MKNLLLCLLILVSSYSFGQDSIQITFIGKIIETAPNRPPISNSSIDIELTSSIQKKKTFTTDSLGFYSVAFKIPRFDSHVFVKISAEKLDYMSSHLIKYSVKGKDTAFTCFADLSKTRICYDTWLPESINFSSTFSDSAIIPIELKSFIIFYKENQGFLKNNKLTVTAYCDYNEKEKAAISRADKIKKILLEKGMSENDFVIIIGGKKDFTHYYNRNGCYTKEESEKHLVISKKEYKSTKDESIKREMNYLRRSVYFGWENRKE